MHMSTMKDYFCTSLTGNNHVILAAKLNSKFTNILNVVVSPPFTTHRNSTKQIIRNIGLHILNV